MNEEIKKLFIRQMLLPKEELAMQTMELLADKMDLQSKIDKAIEYIEKDILNEKIEKVNWDYDDCYYSDMPAERIKPLIDILKVSNDEI